MSRDWIFEADGFICELRAAAVLVEDGNILVQREAGGDEYALPGGHVKAGETLEDALKRELFEEAGLRIACRRLLWSEECFWHWNGKMAHGIAFYYLIEALPDSPPIRDGIWTAQRDNPRVEYGLLPIERLKDATVYPEFLKDEIACLDGPMRHFVSKS